MIKSFRDERAQAIFVRKPVARMDEALQRAAYRKLVMLDAATRLDALRAPPGNRVEALGGDRKGQHSIRINDRWRICFRWRQGDAYEVEIVDYH